MVKISKREKKRTRKLGVLKKTAHSVAESFRGSRMDIYTALLNAVAEIKKAEEAAKEYDKRPRHPTGLIDEYFPGWQNQNKRKPSSHGL
jgi:hypothetical protein